MDIGSICVVGLGYIGLPTATLFANAGIDVQGVDVQPRIVDSVNTGRAHFGEPNLDEMLSRVVAAGRLRASLVPKPSDVFILAVPTPFKDKHEPDLRYVEAATRTIAPVLKPGDLVVLESTSPVGTTERVRDWCAEVRPDLRVPSDGIDVPDVHFAYCPERVLPGRILVELVNNARVIGGLSLACAERAAALYGKIVDGECRITNARTAEMVKLSENAFRDVNIAFANELSLICGDLGINVWELIAIANLHPRVQILEPGPGVGGHCIAVDPWFIVSGSPERATLLRSARAVNDAKPHAVVAEILNHAKAASSAPTIACFGLTYKSDVDDLRESPAIEIVKEIARSFRVIVVEPHAAELPQDLKGLGIELVSTHEGLAQGGILAFLVDHSEFRGIDIPALQGKPVVDPRGIWARRSASF